MQKRWHIGIDFGTSNTYVVGYEKSENRFFETELMAEELRYKDMGIPTVISAERILGPLLDTSKDAFYIGTEALRRPFLPTERNLKNYARSYSPDKSGAENPCDVTQKVEFGNDNSPLTLTIEELLPIFFGKIFERLKDKYDITEKTIEKIVFGCPSMNGFPVAVAGDKQRVVHYEDVLIKAIAKYFKGKNDWYPKKDKDGKILAWGKVEVVPEPELAGLTYLCSGNTENDVILVVDSGGGTTDFSLLYWKNGKIISECIGEQCNIAGDKVDGIILGKVNSKAPTARITKEQCKKGKEDLFLFTDVRLGSSRPRTVAELQSSGETVIDDQSIAYADIESCAQDEIYSKIVENLSAALQSSKAVENIKNEKKINKILFVGGTSFVSPLREAIVKFAKSNALFTAIVETVTPFDHDIGIKFESNHDPVKINCFNAVAVGASIKAIGVEPTIFPTVEFKWKISDPVWQPLFSAEQDGTLAGIIQEDLLFNSEPFGRRQLYFYKELKKSIAFYIRINHGQPQKIFIPINQINQVEKDLILCFSLNEQKELLYSIYDGDYSEEEKRRLPKGKYRKIQEPTKII